MAASNTADSNHSVPTAGPAVAAASSLPPLTFPSVNPSAVSLSGNIGSSTDPNLISSPMSNNLYSPPPAVSASSGVSLPASSVSSTGFPPDLKSFIETLHSQKFRSSLRPFPSFLDVNRCSRPRNATEAWSRLELNLSWYWLNYSIIAILILIIAIITQPSFLITLLVLAAIWWFTLTHEPIVIPRIHYLLQGRNKQILLYCLTALLLILFVGNVILLCVGLAALLIVGHAVVRAAPTQEERDASEEMVQMSVV